MKVAELLEKRRKNWHELEKLCDEIQNRRRKVSAMQLSRFATLYRAACADLALADAYQLPSSTVSYLHRLVGRAHNQLYRTRNFDYSAWAQTMLVDVPQRIFNDRCVHLAFVLFWGAFILCAIMGYSSQTFPGFAERMLGSAQIENMEQMFKDPISGRDPAQNFMMVNFYINHNTGIGLQCFASGLLFIPGIITTLYNAAMLGTSFGYMARPSVDASPHFFEFVTAHGPFELTAIVLSAGAGLRLGYSWLSTNGLSRGASLRKTAVEALPLMSAAAVMFFGAAFIEGLISPSSLPYWFKASVAVITSGLLLFYFVVLGFPRDLRPSQTVQQKKIDWDS